MMSTSNLSRGPSGRFDRGNILPMTLIMMVLGGLIVSALMAFAITILRVRPPLEERSDSLEAVRSAMRMAIVMQRDHGPNGCYESTTSSFRVNNRDVLITCESLDTEDDNGGRFGLIATTNNGEGNGDAPDNEAIRVGDVDTQKIILSSVFVNGGNLGGNNGGLTINAGDVIASTYSSTETSIHRYTTLDPSVDVEVAPLTTCSSLFGPAVLQVDAFEPATNEGGTNEGGTDEGGTDDPATDPTFGYVEPIDFDNQTTLLRVTPDANTDIVAVMHTNSPFPGAQWNLDRSITDTTTGGFDVFPPVDSATTPEVRVCYQQVPATDPNYIPTWLTFCNSPIIDPETFDQSSATASTGVECRNEPWWTYAGWKPNWRTDYIYPYLPQIPSYPRASVPIQVGATNCYVFYPGRYENEVVLDGAAADGTANQFYFASGVYLFNKPLTVKNGVSVVMGEGSYKGCAFDADAAFLGGSPRNHEITGKGATLLLGSDGTGLDSLSNNGSIDVIDSSLRVNRRVATDSTRASAGISVMSINLATDPTDPGDVKIPFDDEVLLPGCLASEVTGGRGVAGECVRSILHYEVGGMSYVPSRLEADAAIIHAELNGSSTASNRVLFGGNLFVPNARIAMSSTDTSDEYVIRLRNGAVASSFAFDFPTGDDSNFLIGQETETVYERLKLAAVTSFDGKAFRSVVELEVDASNRYAINNWVVDAGSGGSTTTGTTTTVAPTATTTTLAGDSTATTTTVAPSSTVAPATTTTSTTTIAPATTVAPSTTTTSTTTTTLPPTSGHDYCNTMSGTWTPGFGDGGHWAAEYRNVSSFISHPNNPFDGAADATEELDEIEFHLGDGKIHADIDKDYYTARFTRRVNFDTACWMALAVGGDDGMRLYLDGAEILGHWSNHSFRWDWDYHYFGSGEHEIVIEYYEQLNDSSLVFYWLRR